MELRDELLAEVGPKTHIADICGRAADELLIKQMKIDLQERELIRLRHFKKHADARFHDHGMQTMSHRLEVYPEEYPYDTKEES